MSLPLVVEVFSTVASRRVVVAVLAGKKKAFTAEVVVVAAKRTRASNFMVDTCQRSVVVKQKGKGQPS